MEVITAGVSHACTEKTEGLFDVTMGAYDSVQVCKLVG